MSLMIPEEDKVCINCQHSGGDRENLPEPCKHCCNGWDGERYEENHFAPDEDYILDEIATCFNCEHEGDNGYCMHCRRKLRADLWEERK